MGQTDVDDWFDLDKYKQAAEVAYSFSKKKLEDVGEQERTTAAQAQSFKQADEARDYEQAQRAYRYWVIWPVGR